MENNPIQIPPPVPHIMPDGIEGQRRGNHLYFNFEGFVFMPEGGPLSVSLEKPIPLWGNLPIPEQMLNDNPKLSKVNTTVRGRCQRLVHGQENWRIMYLTTNPAANKPEEQLKEQEEKKAMVTTPALRSNWKQDLLLAGVSVIGTVAAWHLLRFLR